MKNKILLLLSFLIMSFNVVFAIDVGSFPDVSTSELDKLNHTANNVYGAALGFAFFAGMFIIAYFGIKYYTSGVIGKVKTKDMLIPFLIGIALLTLGPAIHVWIKGLFE